MSRALNRNVFVVRRLWGVMASIACSQPSSSSVVYSRLCSPSVFVLFFSVPCCRPPTPPTPNPNPTNGQLQLVAIKELLGKVKAWVAEAAVVEVSVELPALVTRALQPTSSLTHGPWCIVFCRDKVMWTVCSSCWTVLTHLGWT